MLRDPSLIPLSRQHHNGLALSVLTTRSLTADSSGANLERMVKRAVDRFDLELVNHFELEETLVFPAARQFQELAGLTAELEAEHQQLRQMISLLRDKPDRQVLESFLALLSSHIRREESSLFEQVQNLLPRDVLDRLGTELSARAVEICL